MYGKKLTLYDVLEVSRQAKQAEIASAYRKLSGELRQEKAAPDAKRSALLHEAHEVLSDPARREAYDKSLRAPSFIHATIRRDQPAMWIAAIAALAVTGTVLVVALRSPSDAAIEALPASQIASTASVATGRVQSIDVSGKVTPLGLAFAIGPGLMVTSCHGLKPGAQLLVHIAPRSQPARVASSESETGFCKLAVDGVGSWPLALRGFGPQVNEKVYATQLNAKGEIVLQEAVVKRVVNEPNASFIETSRAVAAGSEGGPLLDLRGRVVGMATTSRHIGLPRDWIDDVPRRRSPSAVDTQGKVVDTPASRGDAVGKQLDNIKAGRDEGIDKAASGK